MNLLSTTFVAISIGFCGYIFFSTFSLFNHIKVRSYFYLSMGFLLILASLISLLAVVIYDFWGTWISWGAETLLVIGTLLLAIASINFYQSLRKAQTSMHFPLSDGKGYLINESKPEHAFKILTHLVRYNLPSLCVSQVHPDDIKKRCKLDNTKFFWLTEQKVDNAISPSSLDIARDEILEFMKKNRGVVVLDGLEYLVTVNGLNVVLRFLRDLIESVALTKSKLIVSVDLEALEKTQTALIKRNLEPIVPSLFWTGLIFEGENTGEMVEKTEWETEGKKLRRWVIALVMFMALISGVLLYLLFA